MGYNGKKHCDIYIYIPNFVEWMLAVFFGSQLLGYRNRGGMFNRQLPNRKVKKTTSMYKVVDRNQG